jgi:hypothetical protein
MLSFQLLKLELNAISSQDHLLVQELKKPQTYDHHCSVMPALSSKISSCRSACFLQSVNNHNSKTSHILMSQWYSLPNHWQQTEETYRGHKVYFDPNTNLYFIWKSWRHRHGGIPQVIKHSSQFRIKVIRRKFKLWDFQWNSLSWWTGFLFVVGSIVWVANGVIAFVTVSYDKAAVWTGFAGGTLFLFGAITAYWLSINMDKTPSLDHTVQVHDDFEEVWVTYSKRDHPVYHSLVNFIQGKTEHSWKWFSFSTSDWETPVYVASVVQLIGATLFEVSVITSLCISESSPIALVDVLVVSTQVVGWTGFAIAGYLQMVEVKSIWSEKLKDVRWHAGFWNALGAIGFGVSAAFAYSTCCLEWGVYFSTLWGAVFFLLSSYASVLESINPHI